MWGFWALHTVSEFVSSQAEVIFGGTTDVWVFGRLGLWDAGAFGDTNMNLDHYVSFGRFHEFRKELQPTGTETVLLPDRRVVRAFLVANPDCHDSEEDLAGLSVYWELDRSQWEKLIRDM